MPNVLYWCGRREGGRSAPYIRLLAKENAFGAFFFCTALHELGSIQSMPTMYDMAKMYRFLAYVSKTHPT